MDDEELPRVEHDDAGYWAVMRHRTTGEIVRVGPYLYEESARHTVAVARFVRPETNRRHWR